MNTILFGEVKERIRTSTRYVNMNCWMRSLRKSHKDQHSCGTVGCIAGHTMMAVGIGMEGYEKLDNVTKLAALLLDIPEAEAEALFTFHVGNNELYMDLYRKLVNERPGTKAYADIVLQAMDRCRSRNILREFQA